MTTEQPKGSKAKAPKLLTLYTKAETQAASARFGVSPDVMAGALRRIDHDEVTRPEVERAIQDFKKRQV